MLNKMKKIKLPKVTPKTLSIDDRNIKKSKYTSTELQALKMAYGAPLTYMDYIKYASAPSILFGSLMFYLTYNLFWGLAVAAFGVYFGVVILLPKAIRQTYIIKSFNERDRFMNLVTQQMSDRTKIPKQVLERVVSRLEGELKDDFFPVTARIANGATSQEIGEMLTALQNKYAEDVIFSQFLEQMETNFTTGVDNISTLQDLNEYHTEIKKRRDEFLRFKKKRIRENVQLVALCYALITALQFAQGDNSIYVQSFANNIVGKIVSLIYVGILIASCNGLQKAYFDDDIMGA